MNVINLWEQTVLIEPDVTPTGLGIAQNSHYIYPISPCHRQSYQKDSNGQTRCNAAGCRKVCSRLDTFATSARVSESGSGIKFFLEYWTGLSGDEFEIGVESSA